VYQLDSYRYWQKHLQRDDFEYGQFGENLTVEGLPDNEVCIGDRYRIGGALFEVTQPRVTCYRVGIRMNHPEMPALLVSHKRPGFYFRVIEEGEIGAGDEIVKVADGPERITVQEIDGLLYLSAHPVDQLQRALRIPALSDGWKQSFATLAAASENDQHSGNAGLALYPATPSAWSGYRSLRVASVKRESEDVLSFVLESEDGVLLPPYLAGQFLAFKLLIDKNTTILRSYSMSDTPDAGKYRISVKRAAGAGSRYFHDRVRAGDLLQVSAPRGSFTLAAGDTPVVFLSAGIGATPVLSMLHSLADANSTREIWWCHGARNGKEHVFAAEARALLRHLPQSRSVIAYSKPDERDQLGRDYDVSGHLTLSLLQQRHLPQNADFYLCGPTSFGDSLIAALQSSGVPRSAIHSEVFGPGSSITPGIAGATSREPHPPAGSASTGPQISFARSGLTVPWDARYGSLLEFAEACDIPVRWSCRVGVCHMCESGLINGRVSYAPEPLDPPASGNLLICCSTPLSEVELDL